MTRTSISTPKLTRNDAKQKYDPKTRSRTSLFARAAAQGTPTRKATRGIANGKLFPLARSRLSHSAHGNITGKTSKNVSEGRAGLASGSKPNIARYRGVVSGIWKTGLDLDSMRQQAGACHIEQDEAENEIPEDEDPQDGALREESDDDEWDERTLIDGLMGFGDQSAHDKTKRQEALTDSLREHFSSLSVSIKQDLLDAVRPVIDNLSTTIALLQKGPDSEYRDGFVAFSNTAHTNLVAVRSITDEFGELKDRSLTRLKHVVGRIETERAKRVQLCETFKEKYLEICTRAQIRLDRVVGEDLDRATVAIETRANALVTGKDKDKEKMRQKILKAFA